MISTIAIEFNTEGPEDIVDITPNIQQAIDESGIASGIITAFVPGSTAAITTIEFEPGLQKDVPALMEKLIPSNVEYRHDATWHDGNGFSHLRAALIGPGVTVPFVDRRPMLGRWQQVVLLEFDNRSRQRRVVLQVMGE